jgi:hypothetical protein
MLLVRWLNASTYIGPIAQYFILSTIPSEYCISELLLEVPSSMGLFTYKLRLWF